jgi:hypothetical protein
MVIWRLWIRGRWIIIDTCHFAPAAIALLLIPLYFLFFDRAPPFKYLGGTILPEIAQEGSTVTRSRLTSWYRSDCSIEVTGHVIDTAGNRLDTDTFMVPQRPMADWVKETNEGKPHRFTKDLLVRLPVDKAGNKHYGELCYYSIDHAWCNIFQRMWPFNKWPVEIDGPMMCFKVSPPAG